MTLPAFDLPLDDGRACIVRVAVPPGLMPADGWPVAYVLDIGQFESMRADPAGLPGLLVGLGVRYGSGCTSGHGVCGISRLSPRSIAATMVFMAAGFATVFLVRHVLAA